MAKKLPLEIEIKAVDRISRPLAIIKRKLAKSLNPLQSLKDAKLPEHGLARDLALSRAFGHELKTAAQSIWALTSRLSVLGIVGGGALGGLIVSSARYGDNLVKTAQKLNISTEQLRAWQYVAERTGVSENTLVQGLERLNYQMLQAKRGNANAIELFKLLGIDTKNNTFNDLSVLLPALAQGFYTLPENINRSAVAMALLGRGGSDLVNLLGQGPEAIAKMIAHFQALVGKLPTDFTDLSEWVLLLNNVIFSCFVVISLHKI